MVCINFSLLFIRAFHNRTQMTRVDVDVVVVIKTVGEKNIYRSIYVHTRTYTVYTFLCRLVVRTYTRYCSPAQSYFRPFN